MTYTCQIVILLPVKIQLFVRICHAVSILAW